MMMSWKDEGLNPLFAVLCKQLTVAIVVPFSEQSGMIQSITILSPIFINKINHSYFTIIEYLLS